MQAEEAKPDHLRKVNFGLLCLVGFLGRLSYEMLRTPVTSLYARHLGAPVPVIGLLVAAVTITGIFVKFPAGALGDLFGFRRLMLSGLMVKASAPFLYLLVGSWPFLLVTRLYHGLSTALYAPAASASVAEAYPHQRGIRLGIYGAAENAGVVLGPVLGAFLLSGVDSSRVFLMSGAIGIAALLAMLLLRVDAAPTERRSSVEDIVSGLKTGLRQILSDPQIRLVSLMEASVYIGVGTLQAYLPLYALTISLPVSRIGLIFGVQGVSSILWRPIAGRLSDRIGRRVLIALGTTLAAAVLVAVPFQSHFTSLLLLGALFGFATGTVTPATTAMIGDLVRGKEFGAAMGVFGSLWDIGHAGGPLIAGMLIGILGYRLSFAMIAAGMFTALIRFFVGMRSSAV